VYEDTQTKAVREAHRADAAHAFRFSASLDFSVA
jgi:hypothetical protein